MHFIIYCLDGEDSAKIRSAAFEAHKAHIAASAIKTIVSGPLLADDCETVNGSFFLVEAEDKDAVVAFNTMDPFNIAGLWKSVTIHPFLKRIDNR